MKNDIEDYHFHQRHLHFNR